MAYEVRIKASAAKQLRRLGGSVRERVLAAIRALAVDPRPSGCKKLRGFEHLFRIRVGDHRVLYAIDDASQVVEVRAAGPRGSIYRHAR